ncbi:MAG: cupin domain-containing protein [Bacteroidales bacterium]|nr:cupin domain-containing protein [Bacteroidales bacterium]MDY4881115.1 cupin domain-containing protein [Muribaculaceae bacterium]
MNNKNAIEHVAHRLKGLRDALDLTPSDIAKACEINVETYMAYESGNSDIPVSFLHRLAHEFNVELTALMFGNEPTMRSYFVTRDGKGIKVERCKAYSYESLAGNFANRVFDPFIVTVEPNDTTEPTLNSHQGQEFNYVLEGSMEITVGSNAMVLNQGDTIIFDAKIPHKMRALNNSRVRFLAIIA